MTGAVIQVTVPRLAIHAVASAHVPVAGTAAETLDTARLRTESAVRMAATANQDTRVSLSMGLWFAALIQGAEQMLVEIWELPVLSRLLLRCRRMTSIHLLLRMIRIRLRRAIPIRSCSSTTRHTTGELIQELELAALLELN